jgi:hypothetical protein
MLDVATLMSFLEQLLVLLILGHLGRCWNGFKLWKWSMKRISMVWEIKIMDWSNKVKVIVPLSPKLQTFSVLGKITNGKEVG